MVERRPMVLVQYTDVFAHIDKVATWLDMEPQHVHTFESAMHFVGSSSHRMTSNRWRHSRISILCGSAAVCHSSSELRLYRVIAHSPCISYVWHMIASPLLDVGQCSLLNYDRVLVFLLCTESM